MSQTSLLVPVDFSPRSAAALRYAAQLAATSGTGLLVLHVLHESAHQAGSYRRFAGDQMSLPLSQVAQTMLDEFILRVCDNTGSPCLPRPQIETLVVDGLPANRILEVADRYEVAQIILGTSIRSRMSRFFHDGVAGQIGNSAPGLSHLFTRSGPSRRNTQQPNLNRCWQRQMKYIREDRRRRRQRVRWV